MYSQKDRLIRIHTQLGDTGLLLERFSGSEAISQPFEFLVEMVSENASIDLKALLRTPAVITIVTRKGPERKIHGRFSRLVQMGRGQEGMTVYHGTIVPWFWFLTLRQDCRIFQNQSVPDIVKEIFKQNGYADYNISLSGSHPPREYCVQYRESDFNFVTRLLEEEGIFYYFDHTDRKHTMMIADRSQGLTPCPADPEASYDEGIAAGSEAEAVSTLVREEKVHTNQIALTDYDFEKPSTDLTVSVPGDAADEVFDYPGKYMKTNVGEAIARIRLEEQEVQAKIVMGSSQCRGFQAGHRFKLKDHFRADTNGDYTLVAVHHQAGDIDYGSGSDKGFQYHNTFEAIPQAVPYRPPRRARKPVVQGSQTAVIVTSGGDDFLLDKYGRVKVHFYWDRHGFSNDTSSCWVRVSQSWAGKNWGWITNPRLDHEVIVDFLEGDPDRPIITGRVYNGEQMPPYPLPDKAKQSGFKSHSSMYGATSDTNEIRFDDEKGNEMFTIHAQKDMETTVEHDKKITVIGKHDETVKEDTTIEVSQGNYSLTLNQGNMSVSISSGKSTHDAAQSIELTCGGSSIKLDPSSITLSAPMIKINGSGMVTIKGGMVMIN